MRKSLYAHTAFALAAAIWGAAPAFAYTPQWLECTGEQAITTGGATTKQPVTEIYVYDPDARNLFKYSESQKRLSNMGAKATSDHVVRWSGKSIGMEINEWEGKLDRSTMSVQQSYKSGSEARNWTESCKPTNARQEIAITG